MSKIQYIKIKSNDPKTRGIQYGEQAEEKIVRGIKNYEKLFKETMSLSWEDIINNSKYYIEYLEKEMPEYLDEAKGIAHGANVSLEEIILLNCRYELTKFSSSNSSTHECTTGAILSEASKDNDIFMIKNWDYKPGIVDNIVVLHIDNGDGTSILGTAEAGQLIRDGINNHGVGLANNNLKSKFDTPDIAIPSTFLRRKVLDAKSYDEALDIITTADRKVSINMMVVSSEDKAIDVEATPNQNDFVKPINGILTHANHFVINPDISAKYSSDFMRDTRLRYLLGKFYKNIDQFIIEEALKDHEFFPYSLCGHDSPKQENPMLGRMTVASMIFNLSKESLSVCIGNPCEGTFETFYLK